MFDSKFKELCVKLNLKVGRFYNTRRSFATLMLQNGQSQSWLTQHMGHHDFSTTMNHYVGELKPNLEAINNLKIS